MDASSLERLEFFRVTRAVAERARAPRAAARLVAALPIDDADRRTLDNRRLAEAIRREREPGAWCAVGAGDLNAWIDGDADGPAEVMGGETLVEIAGWLAAAAETRAAWTPETRERHPELARVVDAIADFGGLRARLDGALWPDGRVRDQASPELARARAGVAKEERGLQSGLERWARGFGENAYVTRHGDRFVALVPAAGFPRRRGIVHDVSNSGQSLFVEPLEMTDANNRVIELRAAAAEEERRVLAALTGAVLDARAPLAAMEEALIELDGWRARARWAVDVGALALEPRGDRLLLIAARHPLLAMGGRRDQVVPLDLRLEAPERLLLLSGPNMGGKTVLLKTVGLAVALAHAAFPVPCQEGSAVPAIAEILADLGDEQSVDRGLSTFAAHLGHLAAMAKAAGPATLLLCDELGAGTDPEEGQALGRALIERFAEAGSWGVVTTHLGGLKRLAGEVPGVVNGSLAFDPDTLTPLYRFLPGVPGASHALSIAERLGLDLAIVARARALEPEETQAFERLVAELHETKRRMEEEAQSLAAARADAEARAAESRAAAEEAKRSLSDVRRRLTRESEVLLGHARELWQDVQRQAKRAEKSRAEAGVARERLAAVEREAQALDEAARAAAAAFGAEEEAAPRGVEPRSLVPGARVRVVDLGIEATVLTAPDAEGKLTLRRGSFQISSHVDKLAAVRGDGPARPDQEEPRSGGASWEVPEEAVHLDVDLRGMEVDEALRTLDDGLDRGIVSGLQELRIIHGIGRGVLRAAVERHLRKHPQVASQRMGDLNEGGRGVTVAKLR